MKASDRRLTPEWLLDAAREMAGGPIALDPCTEPDNPTQALACIARPQNGLDADWATIARIATTGHTNPVVWVNPPFSDRAPWDAMAAVHGQRVDVLTLSAVDYSTEWWRFLARHANARCELGRRVKCSDPETGRLMDVARSCAVWYFGSGNDGFVDAFYPLGAIVDGPQDLYSASTAKFTAGSVSHPPVRATDDVDPGGGSVPAAPDLFRLLTVVPSAT